MTYLLGIAIGNQPPDTACGQTKARIVQLEIFDAAGVLDGSAGSMNSFLRDLVELAGQVDQTHVAPVLELQFGEVITRTAVVLGGEAQYLSITALLPRGEQPESSVRLPRHFAASRPRAGEYEFLWHADEGCHVVVRNIPVKDLADEAGVLDAILDTSEFAKAWWRQASAH
ncbi:hypothetical protein [Noviherbaspirillum cavernae]|uniref:hypothetical protein n=1 Tax=Noviherbaspirillum cavernae TaxID=2320862 RepID=UPI0011C3F6A1|nr:hypothetical protein [Noviherbaspirillum cavernae]